MPLIPPEKRPVELVVVSDDDTEFHEPFESLVGKNVELSLPEGRSLGRMLVTSAQNHKAVLSAENPDQSSEPLEQGRWLHFGWGRSGGYWRVNARVEKPLSSATLLVRCQWPPTHVERRRFVRAAIEGAVADLIAFEDGPERLTAPVINISLGGVAVAARTSRPAETLGLVIHLPDSAEPLCALASVVGTERPEVTRLCFTTISMSSQDDIAAAINRASTKRVVPTHAAPGALVSPAPASSPVERRSDTRYEIKQPVLAVIPADPRLLVPATTIDISKGGVKLGFAHRLGALRPRQEVILHYRDAVPLTVLARVVHVPPGGMTAAFMFIEPPPELDLAMAAWTVRNEKFTASVI